MDGNRRYAKKNNKKIIEGHQIGFETLHSMLEVCSLLGINTVTVYAFSIENFKRPPEENWNKGISSTLNICFSYTSRDEMTMSVKSIVKMVENEQLQIKDVNENLLEQNLFTCGNPPLEILIRTSGEIRLSDFLLWQCSQNCYIKFVNCYWPEFSIYHMLPIILDYQANYKSFKTFTCNISKKKDFFLSD
ncbi:5652_t:CDS:2 [Diversispora eburnea]|uniref:5652_t:CDS:1 n=1 Tax=Diversispora eburnea TaxID=1213867 RepID=A0A9N8WPU6_9GLOM|nr:5652_t:CDS:2 [Diversispora eburnea]